MKFLAVENCYDCRTGGDGVISQKSNGFDRLLAPAWREFALLMALIAATVAVYWPVVRHPFIVLDDLGYVTDNVHIRQLNWELVRWSFTTYRASNWHPLTWLSHALDYRLFGLDPAGHHATNLLLHVLNAVVLFWVLSQATGRGGRSFAVAALFALHPVNVESVAWVAERKNLLSMFFFLLALGAYYGYARKPQIGRYLVVAGLYALGLMCKPQVITLPFVLLLWDYWPLRRMFPSRDESPAGMRSAVPPQKLSWLLLEKVPFLAFAAASAIVTVKAQRAGGTIGGVLNSFSLASRLGNAVLAYVRYLGAAIWPTHLAFFYPHARTGPPAGQLIAAVALLLALTVIAIANRRRRYLAVGWLWFLGTLIPMIGLVQVGSQAMADRYAYLPFVGLFLAVSWGIADWAERWRSSAIWLPAGAITVLLLLALTTRRQLSYWSNDLTLWTHSAEVIKNNYAAENMIGETLLFKGEPEKAMPHFRASAAMEPLFTFPRLHLGIYEEEHGEPHAAIQELQEVLDLTQHDTKLTANVTSAAWVYMSFAYNQLGDYAEQKRCMEMAARISAAVANDPSRQDLQLQVK